MLPDEAVTRWDAFLEKMRERALETLAQGEAGCAELLDPELLDPTPMSVAWSAIENQLYELARKMDETWSQKMAPALAGDARADDAFEKGRALGRWMDREKEVASIRVFAGAAQRVLTRARADLVRPIKCRQCGAELVGPRAVRARHVDCEFCRAVNTVVPSSAVAAVEHFCCHHLAREKSQALYWTWLEAEAGLRADETPAVRSAAEQALRAYHEAYLCARIELMPEYAADFEKDLKGRMAFFYQT